MSRTWLETAFASRQVLRSKAFLSALVVLAVLVTVQVLQNAQGAPRFSAVNGLSASSTSLRVWILLMAALVAARWAATVLDRRLLPQVFVDEVSPTRMGLLALGCGGLLATAAFLALTAEAAIIGWALRVPGPESQSLGDELRRVLLTVVLIWVWAAFGALIGSIVNDRTLGSLTVIGVVTVCFVLDRAGVLFPAVAAVATVSPLGASSVVVYGSFVPAFPAGRAEPALAVAVLLCWMALLLVLFFRRYSAQRSDQLWTAPLWRPLRLSAGRRAWGSWRWVVVTLAPILIVVGLILPQTLNESIPWRYQLSWSTSVAQGTTPADTVQILIQHLAAGREEAARALVSEDAWAVVVEHRADLLEPSAAASAFNLLSAPEPGTVILDLGVQQQLSDGRILLPLQLNVCLQRAGAGWQVTEMVVNLGCGDGT